MFCFLPIEGTEKAHKVFQPELLWHPSQNPHCGKKAHVPHLLCKKAKIDPHKLFGGGGNWGVKAGSPTGHFWATTSLVYCFFLPLQKEGVSTKMAKVTNLHSTHLAPQTPENDKMTKMVGVTQAKAWLT